MAKHELVRRPKTYKVDINELPVVLSTDHEHEYKLNVRRSEADEDYDHLVCRCGAGILQHK